MKTVWGQAPHTSALPTVAEARDRAIDDPRSSMHGRPETVRGDGFVARIWKQERHRVRITVIGTNETRILEASSATDLGEQLIHHEATLLAKNMQARVDPQEPTTIWYATIDYSDGTSEKCEAPDRETLLATLLCWKGRTTAELIPAKPEHLPEWSTKDVEEAIAVRNFLDIVGDQYTPTPKNAERLQNFLQSRHLPMTVENLLVAFDNFNDVGFLDTKESSQ
jgi:hypothetical protein